MPTKYLNVCTTCDGGEERYNVLSAYLTGFTVNEVGCLGRCPTTEFEGGSVDVVKVPDTGETQVSLYGNKGGTLGKNPVNELPDKLTDIVAD